MSPATGYGIVSFLLTVRVVVATLLSPTFVRIGTARRVRTIVPKNRRSSGIVGGTARWSPTSPRLGRLKAYRHTCVQQGLPEKTQVAG